MISRDPNYQSYLSSSTNRELVTVCETISGDGTALLPMIIIPGVIHQEASYTTTGIPDNYLVATSETGYSNDELTIKWLLHLNSFSTEPQSGIYRLSVLDGFGSHCTKQFIEYCDNHKIVVFCLPPHSRHLLQPLDVVVFQPYKHYHAEVVETATRKGSGEFDTAEFVDQIDSIRQSTFKSSTIRSAFHATGLIPFNPFMVISKLREAVPVSYIPVDHVPGSCTTSTIPLSIPTLRAQGQELIQNAQEISPDFRLPLGQVVHGGLALAQSGELAKEHMENAQAAEHSRSARRWAQNRRQIQRGGVIYAAGACQMVKNREAAEVEKAEKQLTRARNAKKKAETAAHKPFLDELKASYKAWYARTAGAKKLAKQQARLQNQM